MLLFTNPVSWIDPVPNPEFLEVFLLLQKDSGGDENCYCFWRTPN